MRWADTPRDVASVSDVTFSIVTDGTAVKKVALGDDGVLAGINRVVSTSIWEQSHRM
jgi:3-hydroxyisobutyrate dehydrogenase-like beta-hydroxyacid dehydrogenase